MELHHLKYFVVLSEELHFGRAAQRLHMAQPPLSQRIKDLEKELGLQLFHRRRTGAELTEAGALLLEHAREVLTAHAKAEEAMRSIRPGTSGILRVSVPPDTDSQTLQLLVEDFAQRAPSVILRLHELTTDEQLGRLRDGELDVAIVRHPHAAVDVETAHVYEVPLGVFMRIDHPLADRKSLALRDLENSALIIFPRNMAPTLYDSFLRICREGGYLPPAVIHARNPNFTEGMLLLGKGIHFNSKPQTPLPQSLTWVPLRGNPLSWKTSAAWLKTRQSATSAEFISSVNKAFSDESSRLASC